MRELDERFATVPDFLVEDVRLDAAAARLAGFAELRDFEAVLRDEDFTAPRLELRDAGFLAVERDEAEREDDLDADERAVVFFAAVFLAAVFLAPDFAEDLAADRVEDFAEVFFAAVLRAVDFVVDLEADFAAVFLAEDLAAVFLAVVFLAAVFFAAVFLAPDLAEDLAADFAEDLVADFEADFAADFFAVVFLAVVFLAPVLAEDFVPFAPLDELRRALLFLPDFLVLVAPVSPVNSIVSGFDLSSVGIAASFKGLRVQPSRLQGNVVIPKRFRLTESVESRNRIFSVDT